LRAISNVKVKLQNRAAPPSAEELNYYRDSVKDHIETIKTSLDNTAAIDPLLQRCNQRFLIPSQYAPLTPACVVDAEMEYGGSAAESRNEVSRPFAVDPTDPEAHCGEDCVASSNRLAGRSTDGSGVTDTGVADTGVADTGGVGGDDNGQDAGDVGSTTLATSREPASWNATPRSHGEESKQKAPKEPIKESGSADPGAYDLGAIHLTVPPSPRDFISSAQSRPSRHSRGADAFSAKDVATTPPAHHMLHTYAGDDGL
jgi:hypothetical protein